MVSLELEGAEDAPGVNEGGVLDHSTREVEIEALPTDIPERIVVDVSALEMAATLTLAEITASRGRDAPPRGARGGHGRDRRAADRGRGARDRGGDRARRRGRRADRGRGRRRGRRRRWLGRLRRRRVESDGDGPVPPPRRRATGAGSTGLSSASATRGRSTPRTRHNVGFEVAALAAERWDLPKAKKKYAGLYTEGRTGPGGPRVGVLLPQTFMNESGRSAGPARGALRRRRSTASSPSTTRSTCRSGASSARVGGGLAGHNGLKSLERELGGRDFQRVRVGVGRPDSTDPVDRRPRTCSAASASPTTRCATLVESAADELERLVTADRVAG